MKRFTGARPTSGTVVENYEHMLMCLICRSLFDDHDHQPKFLPCHHTFCKECLREYVRQMGDDIECPSCRKVATIPAAGVAALQTNFYAKYIQNLVYGSGAVGGDGDAKLCERHPNHVQKYYCDDCSVSICDACSEESGCKAHRTSPVAAAAERLRQDIDVSFTGASTLISQKKSELESRLRALSDEKDRALLRIDSAFETHVHTLGRRATLLKNKVIDVYNENSNGLESGLEEVDTAMTCVVSLREFHEAAVDRGDFDSTLVGRGTAEINEVAQNIADRVRPPEIHIVFDSDHGIEKFRSCTKDLGRVVCNRSVPRPSEDLSSDASLPSAALEADRPEQIRSARANAVILPDELAAGEVEDVYSQFEQIELTRNTSNDSLAGCTLYRSSVSAPAGDSIAAAGIESYIGSQMSDGTLSRHGAGDGPMAAGKEHGKMAGRQACMVTNNNYFSPQSGGCRLPPGLANADLQSRACTSFDEQRLKQELGMSAADNEDPAYCMTRSDFWPHATYGETIISDTSDQGNVIVELSGEQTTL